MNNLSKILLTSICLLLSVGFLTTLYIKSSLYREQRQLQRDINAEKEKYFKQKYCSFVTDIELGECKGWRNY